MSSTQPIPPSTRIRLKNDPGRMGTTTPKIKETRRGRKYLIQFDDGVSGYQPEYELEVIENAQETWDSLLDRGRFGRVFDMQRHLTHIHLNGRLASVVYSMDTTNTKFYPYQYKPLLSFLESPVGGLLIADEVGLGKTIEAGLVWTELRARRDARRVLVICPAMLRDKWCDELENRFGVDAQIMNAKQLFSELRKERTEVPDGKGIVCSIEGLRPPGRDKIKNNPTSSKAQLATLLDEKRDDEPLIDLCIIDEAHYLRNPDSQNNKLGRLIRRVTENILLLSATPVNLKSDDLYYLLKLIDPDYFQEKQDFPEVLEANAPLIQARDTARHINSSPEGIHEMLKTAYAHPFLTGNRQLKTLLQYTGELQGDLSAEDRVKLADRIGRVNMLAHVVNRTRKREVNEFRVVRYPHTYHVPMSKEEATLYGLVTTEVRNYAAQKDIHEGFLLASPQRQVSSCMYAALKSWEDKEYDAKELIYEDQGNTEVDEPEIGPLIQHIISTVLPKVELQEYWDNDSKYNKLEDVLRNYFAKSPNEKIIIFSYFKGSIHYLSKRLAQSGFENMTLYGGVAKNKQEYIAEFKDSPTAKILIASEVASEGVDLQFCKMLINYDLPWNPMKVEQRIGRIDRIGQEAKAISILNLCHADTIDHKIVERLHTRLGVFEKSIGELEPILGPIINKLTNNLIRHDLTPNDVEKQLKQTEQAIEQKRLLSEKLENEAANLVAHGDYIIQKVKAAADFRQRISPEDLLRYVRFFLEKYSQGHTMTSVDPSNHLYEIKLSPNIAAEYGEYALAKKSYGATKLHSGRTVKCQFANKVHKLSPHIEQISQFHPLIRFISSFLDIQNEPFYPLVSAKLPIERTKGVPPGVYAFAVSRWRFEGVRVDEEIKARVMPLCQGDMQHALPADHSLELVNMVRAEGDDWLSIANHGSEISGLEDAIFECFDQLADDFDEFSSLKEDENYDRVSFQIASIKRNRKRRLATLYAVLSGHEEKNPSLVPATKKRIENFNSRCDVQIEKYEMRKALKRSQDQICCGALIIE